MSEAGLQDAGTDDVYVAIDWPEAGAGAKRDWRARCADCRMCGWGAAGRVPCGVAVGCTVIWWLATAICGVMWLIGAYRNRREEADPWFGAGIVCATGGLACLAVIKCWRQGRVDMSCCPGTVNAHQQGLVDDQLEHERISGELALQNRLVHQSLLPDIALVVLEYLGTSPSANLIPDA
jgi:hypothetical protein